MSIRLNKALRELNIGLQTAVEFLENKKELGEVKAEPSFKISDEQYQALNDAFSKDKEVRDQAEKLFTKKTKDKKRAPEQKNNRSENVLESGRQQYKPLGKIDLDSLGKKSAVQSVADKPEVHEQETAAVSPAPNKEIVKAENKDEKRQQNVSQHKQNMKQENQQKTQQAKSHESKGLQNGHNQQKAAHHKGDNQPSKVDNKTQQDQTAVALGGSSVFTLKSEKKMSSNEPKVLGKIDLSSLNQSTRPKKKSKEERRKEREEKLAQQHSERKKRVRINKERVDINAEAKNNNGDGGNGQNRGNNGGNKKNRNKNRNNNNNNNKGNNNNRGNQRQIEVDDEAVARQVKETLARLTSKSQNKKGAKYRKEKREAVQEKLQDQARQEQKESKTLKLTEFVTVSELATMMDISVTQVISTLMGVGIMVSINQRLDAETINMVAEEFGFKTEYVSAEVQEAVSEEEDDENDLVPRAPIVTVMGHVDHGKTSLLDYIRNTNVIAGEAGGITQHIGAYSVTLNSGRKVTFLDTPGHEAFTAMRARGAKMTDVAIIIVAADDCIMPQTVEAINHAQAAGVPMVFAINKIDKPGANPEKIREQLSNMNILVEDWGGSYQCQEISAKKGINVEQLLEKVLLEAEMLELKANPNKRASGAVIESSLDKGRGYLATILVQNGTLRVGDVMLSGCYTGRVKAMFNERGQKVTEAGPSTPVSVLGLNGAPTAGETFVVMADEKEAKDIANKREQLIRIQGIKTQKHMTLEEIGRRIAIGNFKELNVIVKGDVDGSVEALSDSIIKLSTEEVRVNVIHKAVGAISESDILLAAASDAIIIGFQVRPMPSARKLAEKEEIEIRLYSVIYDCINELKSGIEGMLEPEQKEVVTATAEVQETFKISKVGTIAGCIVREGKLTRTAKVRVIRDGIVIYTGELGSLKRFKDDVKEVHMGMDCGLNIQGYNDIKVGDVVEAYTIEEIKRTL